MGPEDHAGAGLARDRGRGVAGRAAHRGRKHHRRRAGTGRRSRRGVADHLVGRFAVVRPFLPMLCTAIAFGATAEATPVLDALRAIPDPARCPPVGPGNPRPPWTAPATTSHTLLSCSTITGPFNAACSCSLSA